MRKIFTDLVCEKCGNVKEDEFIPENYLDDKERCLICGGFMVPQIGFGSFKLEFNQKRDLCDWHGNHNSYWDAVKKARSEGKKVKACNEN